MHVVQLHDLVVRDMYWSLISFLTLQQSLSILRDGVGYCVAFYAIKCVAFYAIKRGGERLGATAAK